MRSLELRSHLGLFCSTRVTVQELVSCAEAYRASRTEVDLISDEEEAAAVTHETAGLAQRLSSGLSLQRIKSMRRAKVLKMAKGHAQQCVNLSSVAIARE